jgi:hypothetical protein
VRPLALILALAACRTGSARGGSEEITYSSVSAGAGDDEPAPPYDKAELERALIAERAAEARAGGEVRELGASGDTLGAHVARTDLAIRRRFLALLELCEAGGRGCPPRLDDPAWRYALDADVDPTLDVPLRFDLDSWRAVTGELHGRACACRTQVCIDSIEVAIARLEARPRPEVQADEVAIESITRARTCLARLAGRRALPRVD